jgi:hypothetical protein
VRQEARHGGGRVDGRELQQRARPRGVGGARGVRVRRAGGQQHAQARAVRGAQRGHQRRCGGRLADRHGVAPQQLRVVRRAWQRGVAEALRALMASGGAPPQHRSNERRCEPSRGRVDAQRSSAAGSVFHGAPTWRGTRPGPCSYGRSRQLLLLVLSWRRRALRVRF